MTAQMELEMWAWGSAEREHGIADLATTVPGDCPVPPVTNNTL